MSSSEGRAWEQVLNHLEQMLVTGELGPGQRLPPERTLAAQLASAGPLFVRRCG